MSDISTRATADNVPEDLMKRLIGTVKRDTSSISFEIRTALNKHLPPLKDVEVYYLRSLTKN